MKYSAITIFLSLLVSMNSVQAENKNQQAETEVIGFGGGALIGGLLGGPIGAVLGAAGGGLIGSSQQKQQQISDLQERLKEREFELNRIQSEFLAMQATQTKALHEVAIKKQQYSLESLSKGISLSVFFKTNQHELTRNFKPVLKQLATYLNQFPEIKIQLEAHADQRGGKLHNRKLSEQRAYAVLSELVNAGLSSQRVYIHALGESQAQVQPDDIDGMAHERRVDLSLTLDTQI